MAVGLHSPLLGNRLTWLCPVPEPNTKYWMWDLRELLIFTKNDPYYKYKTCQISITTLLFKKLFFLITCTFSPVAPPVLRTIRPEHVVRSVYKATGCTDNPNHVIYLEHVVVRITITHPRRGDLSINLTSPSGTKSQLLANRYMMDTGSTVFRHWVELHLFLLELCPLGCLCM